MGAEYALIGAALGVVGLGWIVAAWPRRPQRVRPMGALPVAARRMRCR